MTIKRCLGSALLFCAFAAPQPARSQDVYYLLVFSSQRPLSGPNYSHSFATFVRAGCGTPGSPIVVKNAFSISWLPANMEIRSLALLPECGRNFDLYTTLRFARDTCQRVSLWGPYQIDPDLYRRAADQFARLQSGQILYKADDVAYGNDCVSNCIHAVGSITGGPRLRVLPPGWGDTASYFIVLEFMPWIIDPDHTHDWVASALGLDNYPIAYRVPPRRGLIPPATGLRIPDRWTATPTYGSPRIGCLRCSPMP
jgi:hypothetical protein